jgi:uncharacterized membrane protein YgcG
VNKLQILCELCEILSAVYLNCISVLLLNTKLQWRLGESLLLLPFSTVFVCPTAPWQGASGSSSSSSGGGGGGGSSSSNLQE